MLLLTELAHVSMENMMQEPSLALIVIRHVLLVQQEQHPIVFFVKLVFTIIQGHVALAIFPAKHVH